MQLINSIFSNPAHNQKPSAWIQHIPFAYFLVEMLKPKLFVELGTHYGNSYFASCQAIFQSTRTSPITTKARTSTNMKEQLTASWSWRITKPLRTLNFHTLNRLRMIPQVRRIGKSELFDAGFYLQKYPDVKASGMAAAKHYFLYGGAEGRNPSGKFDSAFYLAENPDVAKSGINPLLHYLLHGKDEGRKVKLVDDSLFDFKMKVLGMDIPEDFCIDSLVHREYLIENLCGEKFQGTIWPENGETMIGFLRLTNLEHCILDTIKNNIEGDLIETGVWRGGACIFMREILKLKNITNKSVWLADSFQGLPKPNSDIYPDDLNDKLHTFNELVVSEEEVKNNFEKYNLLDDQVKFLKGWFKDTMPNAPIEKLSILRLDGDMYESTIDVLFYLYPKLSIGGYCIIDDWGAVMACKKAVEDYRRVFDINEEIRSIDWTGIFWKKEVEIPLVSRHDFMQKLSQKNHSQQFRK